MLQEGMGVKNRDEEEEHSIRHTLKEENHFLLMCYLPQRKVIQVFISDQHLPALIFYIITQVSQVNI